ncbi:MAG TPA: endonuclease/exonuclease/phosphatase family protein [Thermoleophilaceae bacterium]|nr:endonuclease/exonuclease/phosphatase family protein [Thermoleophilaceae bacterium]
MQVLTWNLYHGRDFPPDPALLTLRSRILRGIEPGATHAQVNRSLLPEFALWLDRREWSVALLQEAPPRWFEAFAKRTRSSAALALTSRNLLPALQRRLADLNPDLLASSEGGSNQTLVRHPGRIVEVRRMRLANRPERRTMLWTRIELPEGALCTANLHASAGLPDAAAGEVKRAAEQAVEWARGEPLIFGGDFNLRPRHNPEAFAALRESHGLGEPTAADAIDHLLTRGLDVVDPPRRLDPHERELPDPQGLRIRLSDHAPVVAVFRLP